MDRLKALLLVGTIFFVFMNAVAQLMPLRIRGTVAAFDGHSLQLKTREGKMAKVAVTADTKINLLIQVDPSDIKQGRFVGITAVQKGPGAPLQAREVHVFSEAQRGAGEGHYDWDLEPGSSMTNANVDAVVETNTGKELTLSYKGGSQKIVVPRGVPIVTFAPADKSLLKAGARVFVSTQQAADGKLTAQYISIGKDGLAPPM